MSSLMMLDADWVRRSFLVPTGHLSAIDARNRFFSSASLKYNDTSPGGAACINPPPQFTRTADVKPVSIRAGSAKANREKTRIEQASRTTSMGRYYSEAIDDNNHLVHFRMGKTAYNSMLGFLSSYYSYKAAYVARTGRAPGIFYQLGRAAGFLVAITNWKVFATLALGRMFRFVMNGIDFAKGIPRTKYAYLKPTMPVYWSAVQSMVNQIAAYMGLVTVGTGSRLDAGNLSPEAGSEDYGYLFDNNLKAKMTNMIPDVFDEQGNLNVYALATKGQRLANRHRMELMNHLGRTENLSSAVDLYRNNLNHKPSKNFETYMDQWMQQGSIGFFKSTNPDSAAGGEITDDMKDADNGFLSHLHSALNDGAEFVTFRVEEGGGISESFSNSAAESEVKGALDSVAAAVRTKFDTFAGGNVLGSDGVGGAIQSVMTSVTNAAKEAAAGTLQTFGLSGLMGLGSGSFADVPQHWDSSSASMPRANYTIKLNTPYNNPVSKLIHEIVPLCMLLTMALPHATGPQSYGSPFMLEFYDRGRAQCRYGMVDSISITRGTASTPYSQERMYNGIEVNISILDLTSTLYMPLSSGYASADNGNTMSYLMGALGGSESAESLQSVMGAVNTASNTIETLFTDDTNYTDYLAVLSGVGLADNIYAMRKLRNILAKATADWKTHYSVPAAAMTFGDSAPMQMARFFFRGSDKAF